MRQIILDTETTGLEPSLGHRIIEIGCIELIDRRPSGRTFQRYLDPEGLRRDLPDGLASFGGTRRRFEIKGEAGGVQVVDDYAHHPSEVSAVLRAAREVAGQGRVLAVFQPHLYSRTRIFAAEFARSLGLADEVVVMDVFAAREDPEPGVSGELIAAAVPLPSERVAYVSARPDVVEAVALRCRPGDLVLTIGAGDVTLLGPQLLDRLRSASWPA